MSDRSHTLVQQWLQEAALSDNELQQWSVSKPYFSAAQLLWLKRLDANSAAYAEQKKQAALHVHNPLQLEAQTSDFPFDWNTITTDTESEILPVTEVEPELTSIEEKEIETFDNLVDEHEFVITDVEEAAEENTDAEYQKEKETFVETTPVQEPVVENEFEQHETIEPESTITKAENFTSSSEQTAEEENVENSEIAPIIKLPTFDPNAPANPSLSDITFEPFHTVDYFASQGIKLSQTEASNDRFGKQVKSFTEWLKTMKKLPTTAITQNTDGVGEKKVANLAAHSLQNADVVTESMAEVWVKQGNIQKASEVYNKLSLQNPSKKAYFAAKIESLKKPS